MLNLFSQRLCIYSVLTSYLFYFSKNVVFIYTGVYIYIEISLKLCLEVDVLQNIVLSDGFHGIISTIHTYSLLQYIQCIARSGNRATAMLFLVSSSSSPKSRIKLTNTRCSLYSLRLL